MHDIECAQLAAAKRKHACVQRRGAVARNRPKVANFDSTKVHARRREWLVVPGRQHGNAMASLHQSLGDRAHFNCGSAHLQKWMVRGRHAKNSHQLPCFAGCECFLKYCLRVSGVPPAKVCMLSGIIAVAALDRCPASNTTRLCGRRRQKNHLESAYMHFYCLTLMLDSQTRHFFRGSLVKTRQNGYR